MHTEEFELINIVINRKITLEVVLKKRENWKNKFNSDLYF